MTNFHRLYLLNRLGFVRYFYMVFRRLVKGSIYRPYYDETESVFIHVPKAAGKSVAGSLYNCDKPGHFFATDYRSDDAVKFNRYYKFAFVRDPYSRLESAYYFLVKGGATKKDAEVGGVIKSETSSFDDFVINWLNDKKIYSWHHFIPQYKYISDGEKILVDYVGRFETIEQDFSIVASKIGLSVSLGKANVNSDKKKAARNPIVESKIRKLYAKDYAMLGY